MEPPTIQDMADGWVQGGGGEPPQVTVLGQSRHRADGVGHPAVSWREGEDAPSAVLMEVAVSVGMLRPA